MTGRKTSPKHHFIPHYLDTSETINLHKKQTAVGSSKKQQKKFINNENQDLFIFKRHFR
jgi:hypothetical protein